ncbi:hypothetical protein EDC04DRAFT_400255 [Pisolithus marmoratus]|nr:hypothetical protein EDC04DRAFT_400255 [Pisolithus marmoratus]
MKLMKTANEVIQEMVSVLQMIVYGSRFDIVSDLVSDCVEPSIEAGMLTPLYAIASPQAWRRHLACVQRRERFKSIREHFYALVNMRQLAGTEAHRKSVNKRGAMKFFSDLFGLQYLRNYIGEITLFERLPSMIEIDSLSEGSVGAAEGGPATLTDVHQLGDVL